MSSSRPWILYLIDAGETVQVRRWATRAEAEESGDAWITAGLAGGYEIEYNPCWPKPLRAGENNG